MPPEQKLINNPVVSTSSTVKTNKLLGVKAALLVSLAAYVVSQLILFIPIGIISSLNPGQNIDTLLNGSTWIQFTLAIFSAIGLLLVLWLYLRTRHQGFKDLGFKKPKISDFGWLAIVVVIYLILLTIGMTLASNIPGFNADQQQDIGYKGGTPVELIVAFFGLVILPPLAEEMLFRGFMYRGLANGFASRKARKNKLANNTTTHKQGPWPKIFAAFVTSLLFALVHFQWNVGVDVFILSMVLIFLYEKTKNLWMCVFLHALKNGMAFIMLFFVT